MKTITIKRNGILYDELHDVKLLTAYNNVINIIINRNNGGELFFNKPKLDAKRTQIVFKCITGETEVFNIEVTEFNENNM